MADIDDLRGAPKGYTENSSVSSPKLKEAAEKFRKAAITIATTMSFTTPMAAKTQETQKDPVDDGHKIEIVEQPKSFSMQQSANTISFLDEVAKDDLENGTENKQQLNPNDISIKYIDDEEPYYLIEGIDGYSVIYENQLDANKIENEILKDFHNRTKHKVKTKKYRPTKTEEAMALYTGQAALAGFDYVNNVIYEFDYRSIDEKNHPLANVIIEHEKTHAKDCQNPEVGIWDDKTDENKSMISNDLEINGNITELAMALDKYKVSGNIDDIKTSNTGDLKEFKKWLQENPDKIGSYECNLRGALAIKQGFLTNNNVHGSPYLKQAEAVPENISFVTNSYAATEVTTQASIEEYMKARREIYANTALGDVNAVMGHYVKLGQGAKNKSLSEEQQELLQHELFLLKASGNTTDMNEATHNIASVLHAIRDAQVKGDDSSVKEIISGVCARNVQLQDMQYESELTNVINQANLDGNITPEEQAQIDIAIKKHVQENQQSNAAKSTTKNNNVKYGAAMAASVIMAATPMAAQAQNTEHDPIDDGHKIELTEQPRTSTNENDANTIYMSDYVEMESMSEPSIDANVNVRYDSRFHGLRIEGNDGSRIIVSDNSLDGEHKEQEAATRHAEVYSREVRDTTHIYDLDRVKSEYQALKEEREDDTQSVGMALASANADENEIVRRRLNHTDEFVAEGIRRAEESNNADSLAIYSYMQSLKEVERNPQKIESLVEHEMSHNQDARDGMFEETKVTENQLACLDMTSETLATMTQVKLEYDKIIANGGNIDDLDKLNGWHAGDLKDFKEWARQNPDKIGTEECEQMLGIAVFNGWLNKNNKEGTGYYQQAMRNSIEGGAQAGSMVENQANKQEFMRRMNHMLSNTPFGDLTQHVNMEFSLGYGNQTHKEELSDAERFVQNIAGNAQTTLDATRNIRDVVNVYREADKDGVRTPEEQAQINQAIANASGSMQIDKKTKDGITVARKTGRNWAYRKSATKESGMEKTQENNNINVTLNILNMANQGRS